jgi:hypothetical protein
MSDMKKFPKLPFRQIHLDFHTSEYLKNIGVDFEKKAFQECLTTGHVDSITLFATCHHGWTYYDSRLWEKHPHMTDFLLPKMLEAANEIGVQTPIYLTVGWNERVGRLHPDWVVKKRDGSRCSVRSKANEMRQGWQRICLNTPYLEELIQITNEIMIQFNPVGLFYDIVWEQPCYCDSCLKSMNDQGIDIDDDIEVIGFARQVYLNYLQKITRAVWDRNSETRVYHNGADKKGRDDILPYYSHYEIESLPTTNWCGGYESFPQKARYFQYKVSDFLGMTGKFHESWGEFGGYKNPDALRYETMRMIMYGGKCSVGDQMLPEGSLDPDTYGIIGRAYAEVKSKEAWCENVTSIADIGVVCPSAIARDINLESAEIGASMMLSENQFLFDMIDQKADFLNYKLLILPDYVLIDDEILGKLNNYLSRGGKIMASGLSGMDSLNEEFKLDYGANYIGESDWYIDFTIVKDSISKNIVRSPYFNFLPGPNLGLTDGEVLADTVAPHFNRTSEKFCSHGNTPPGNLAGYPSVIRKGDIIYIGPKVFTMYREKGMKLHRDLVRNCMDLLIDKKRLITNLPSGAQVSFNQIKGGNKVLHILYASPILRGNIPVIEDIVPLNNIQISICVSTVSRVLLVPENKELDFTFENEVCSFVIPIINLHQMVEICS